ncbi:uncharacterized protein BP5553_08224 [Venustampulla echinocandica]|uniref:Uncharacterized protein n=1 Tax=Venustampulla echinocandica TaxID=2656787 RepID=A0A370TG26_9HELO|nr:uncharacterized protein BP5553_08224 [Venustampulla echinocandica]RDL33856.1 hypothetical protein BP5553_08224 [Venustampulla echinocandica]
MSNNNISSTGEGEGASPSRSRSRSLSPHNSLTDKHSTSLPWILHHILERELSNELPLRIMFSFNAGQQLPTLKQAQQWWQYEPKGKLIIEFLSSLPQIDQSSEQTESENKRIQNSDSEQVDDGATDICEVDRFMNFNHDLLFDISSEDHPSADRRQTHGFPPHFVRDICLQKVFLKEYKEVDFGQALTCLDYLRDLELSRRTALREVAERLNIKEDSWRSVLQEEPEAYAWVSSVQLQELEIEKYYAAIFVDLRIWTMVHELQYEPFYKPNVLAMLNTLFPPSLKDMPNDRVDIKTLNKYRSTFYGHILAVEAQGSAIVKDFIDKLLSPDTKHSWPETRNNLVAYIELAEKMITQAKEISGMEFFKRNSLRNSKSSSDAPSPFSERPGTASSATTSVDNHMSPISNPKSADMGLKDGDTIPGDSGHKTMNDLPKADAVFEQSAPGSHSSLIPPPLQGSEYSILRKRTPKLSLKTEPKTPGKSTFSSRFRAISKSKVSPLTLSPDSLHYTRHPPTVSSPLVDPRNKLNTDILQESDTQPPRTGGLPIEPLRNLQSKVSPSIKSDTNTSAATSSKKTAVADSLDFLNRPYEPPSHPKLKSKASLSSMFLRRKSSFGPAKLDTSNTSLRNPHEEMKIEPPSKLSKQKSLNSIEKARPKTPTVRSSTWTESPQPAQPPKLPPSPRKRLRGRKSFSTFGNRSNLSTYGNRTVPPGYVSHVRKDTISNPIFVYDESNPYERYRLVPDPRLPPADPIAPAVPSSPTRAGITEELRQFNLSMSDTQETSTEDTTIGDGESLNKKINVKSQQIQSPDFFRPTNFSKAHPDGYRPANIHISSPELMGEDEADFHANEWSRKWLIADSIAIKTGTLRPSGSPLRPAFEQPRATPQPPGRPRQLSAVSEEANVPAPLRIKSLRKMKKEKQKHVEIDVSRFSKY